MKIRIDIGREPGEPEPQPDDVYVCPHCSGAVELFDGTWRCGECGWEPFRPDAASTFDPGMNEIAPLRPVQGYVTSNAEEEEGRAGAVPHGSSALR